ncbi:selenium metabolism-associated LysR family transcriptional regulator [Peptococcus simiae]|uniref:selenium metabolism-associated LysR family transcriptional regulator n=1 Tax=Peptococcus simiae TaxID=1643805 RepID=UPI00397EC5E9
MLNDSIRVFLMVVEKKSFSKAAKALFLTQPAVSFQIQMLEEHYSTRLFDRVSRNIILTESGELLYKFATEMSNMQQNLERDMQELNSSIIGRLRIGASNTIGEYIAPYILGNFKKRHPKVTLSLDVSNSDEIEMAIHGTTLDVGLVEGPPVGKDLESIPFLDDELVVITSPDHPWAKLDSISVFELDKYPFISREKGSGTRAEIEHHLKLAGFSANNLNVIMRLGSTTALKTAVKIGHGFTILSHWAIKNELKAGTLSMTKLKEDEFKRRFRIVYHKKKFKTQANEEFLRFLKTEHFF